MLRLDLGPVLSPSLSMRTIPQKIFPIPLALLNHQPLVQILPCSSPFNVRQPSFLVDWAFKNQVPARLLHPTLLAAVIL